MQAKGQEYSPRNSIEISGILNSIPDDDMESIVVSTFKDSGVEVDAKDTEGCHRLSLTHKK